MRSGVQGLTMGRSSYLQTMFREEVCNFRSFISRFLKNEQNIVMKTDRVRVCVCMCVWCVQEVQKQRQGYWPEPDNI